ncbi:MAG: hypothetical protein PHS53_02885 [Candidatus Pacebacteria bacterium]|nr:hypothetical protein [Candidatus Paceibacterota bacterium]MDD5357070.1 hypothetical protein [Candidatus Paceibacterota bacterium]
MKTKIVFIGSALLLSGALFSVVGAQGLGVKVDTNVGVEAQGSGVSASTETEVHGNATSSAAKNEDRGNATSSEAKENNENASSTSNAGGSVTAEAHRSTVATFVKTLLAVADREGGIGAEVRAVAQAQNDSATTTASAMAKVEERGAVRTFLFGSDYKNLGVIRSQIAVTSNNIDRLKKLLDRTTSVEARAELNAQIQVLQDEQVKLDAFVTAHEDTFSVFGWFVKLFQE